MNLTQEEKEELATENYRFIHYMAKKYCAPQWNYDDLVGAASLGMSKALNTFDKEKGIKFSTYSARCMANEIFMLMRNERKQPNTISIELPLNMDKDGQALRLEDVLANTENELDWREISPAVNAVLAKLPERNRKVMRLYFGNVKQQEIGKQIGLSQTYVSRIITAALAQIKKEYWRGEETVANKKLDLSVEEFIDLRYKQKLSYAKIAELKGVAESTILYWKKNCKELEETEKQEKPVQKTESENNSLVDFKKEIEELRTELLQLKNRLSDAEQLQQVFQDENTQLREDNEHLKLENSQLHEEVESLRSFHMDPECNVKYTDLLQENEALRFLARRYLAVQ